MFFVNEKGYFFEHNEFDDDFMKFIDLTHKFNDYNSALDYFKLSILDYIDEYKTYDVSISLVLINEKKSTFELKRVDLKV